MFVDVLPWWERWAYWTYLIGALVCANYAVFVEGDQYLDKTGHILLQDGWSWLSRKQDVSDRLWEVWKSALWTFLPMNIVRVISSLGMKQLRFPQKVQCCLLLAFDLSVAVWYFGLLQIGILLCAALMNYVSTFSGSTLIVWLMGLATITPLNLSYVSHLQVANFGSTLSLSSIMSAGFCCLRIISFTSEKVTYRKSRICSNMQIKEDGGDSHDTPPDKVAENALGNEHRDGKDNKTLDHEPDFIEFLFYLFYLPTFLVGPVVIYSDFQKQIKSPNLCVDFLDIFKQITKVAFWCVFIEFQSHFVHFCALRYHITVFKKMSLLAILGIVFMYGQLFMVKHVCLYGFSIQMARFDGIEPIPTPRCIYTIYSYTDMWKYFDVGLYRFMMKHIYIPLGGSRSGILKKLMASCAAFMFVFWWHGGFQDHFIWCLGNFVTGTVEFYARKLELTSLGTKLKSYLSPAMILRVKGVWYGLMYIIAHLQTFCFLFDTRRVLIIVDRAILKASWSSRLYGFAFYTTLVHSGLYFEARRKAKTS